MPHIRLIKRSIGARDLAMSSNGEHASRARASACVFTRRDLNGQAPKIDPRFFQFSLFGICGTCSAATARSRTRTTDHSLSGFRKPRLLSTHAPKFHAKLCLMDLGQARARSLIEPKNECGSLPQRAFGLSRWRDGRCGVVFE